MEIKLRLNYRIVGSRGGLGRKGFKEYSSRIQTPAWAGPLPFHCGGRELAQLIQTFVISVYNILV